MGSTSSFQDANVVLAIGKEAGQDYMAQLYSSAAVWLGSPP